MKRKFLTMLVLLLLLLQILTPLPSAAEAEQSDPQTFADVLSGAFYEKPVQWALAQGITNGVDETHFAPAQTCTRAQVVTFLWRAAGGFEPVRQEEARFSDLSETAYYYKAVLWAVENGITTGVDETHFAPDKPCTRAQIVTFLWRAAGCPDAKEAALPFTDLKADAYYLDAIRWASEKEITAGVDETHFAPEQPCNRAQVVTFLFRNAEQGFTQQFDLYFGTEKLDTPLRCVGNRPYVCVQTLETALGTELTPLLDETALRYRLRERAEGDYISLIDAAKLWRLGVRFEKADSAVRLYRLAEYEWTPQIPKEGEGRALLRLEDITADQGINGRFTHENLNKLRLFCDYLQDHGSAFYIAWIPLYVNPGLGVTNDISKDESFYNADFVFTLDWMQADGGLLGLHGLTHQSGEEISADGFEFGSQHDYTDDQLRTRFMKAEDICKRLGYRYYFFEFPHYAVTQHQAEIAEQFFDVIYQQYPYAAEYGYIERRVQTNGHSCLWVPTPADYVHSKWDYDGIAQRLSASEAAGWEMSLFFHPVIDQDAQRVTVNGDTMQFRYDEENGILPRIVRLLEGWNYRFGPI